MSRKLELEKKKYLEAQEAKRVKENLETYAKSHNNQAPVSRRDFLSAGILPFAASMTLPTLSSMLIPRVARAQAEGCPVPDPNDPNKLAPFVTLNLAGGAMLAGNYVAMDQGGQLLPTYNKLGLGNASLPITREFNNAPFAGNGISNFIESLRGVAAQTTLDNTAFVAIPCRSQDDSGNNRFDISGMIAKAGLLGVDLPNLGRRDSDTGVNQRFAKVKPPNPLRVGNFNDIVGALGGGGTGALASLSKDQKVSFFNLIKNLNDSQVQKVVGDSGGQMLANLIGCASEQNVTLAAKDAPPLDVRQDASTAGIWGVNANTGNGDENVVFGSMVLAGLSGAAGTIALERGGYDYHNNTRTRGNDRDAQAGEVVGKVLQSAAALGQKVFVYVTSDGACNAPVSDSRSAPWTSDRGSAGMAFIFAYDPAGRPATNGFQIGQFTAAQAADDNFITGGSPEMAASAAFANYLQFNNRLNMVEQVIPGTFSTEDLNKIIKFG